MKDEITQEEIARVCHEANRAYCAILGDISQPAWDDAPEWQKQSARKGAGFHIEHPEATAAASHESWLEVKRQEGWTYGPVKDSALKTHPCFVPFSELPRHQQAKDFLFRAIVHGICNSPLTVADH